MRTRIAFIILLFSLSLVFAQSTRKAPNFVLEDINGKNVELKSLIGKGPILISFWATWCKPCIEKMVELQKIYHEYSSKGFIMLAISTDNEKSVGKVKPLVKSKNWNFQVLLDKDGEVQKKYYVQAVPYSVLLDKKGNIIYTHEGYMKGDELQIKKILDEKLSD